MRTFISLVITVLVLATILLLVSREKTRLSQTGHIYAPSLEMADQIEKDLRADYPMASFVRLDEQAEASSLASFLFYGACITVPICSFLIIQLIVSRLWQAGRRDPANRDSGSAQQE